MHTNITALTQGEKSYERKELCNHATTANAKCHYLHMFISDPLKYFYHCTLLLLPSLQSKLSEISEEGSQAERKQEVLELHNEVLQ